MLYRYRWTPITYAFIFALYMNFLPDTTMKSLHYTGLVNLWLFARFATLNFSIFSNVIALISLYITTLLRSLQIWCFDTLILSSIRTLLPSYTSTLLYCYLGTVLLWYFCTNLPLYFVNFDRFGSPIEPNICTVHLFFSIFEKRIFCNYVLFCKLVIINPFGSIDFRLCDYIDWYSCIPAL